VIGEPGGQRCRRNSSASLWCGSAQAGPPVRSGGEAG
jgi:hypothetical protein